ncbi:hypothetical protein GCWU000341_02621 [Oribacterium sp. oral taxon 078 str. F0262]|uniref:DUF4349 domain-containing protein n=1 Tax=Oribacterium sp. oral taxon 078 TaxID=652706 RepID=UPI0001BCBA6F|nr:DUF4349 domain-containing protein [Oribacterium sp. oral taxon 078]EFE90734.1 hypothetical protein GCWU000341_02621 [Oribacterium sp. oral taxon 078 str. F0262]
MKKERNAFRKMRRRRKGLLLFMALLLLSLSACGHVSRARRSSDSSYDVISSSAEGSGLRKEAAAGDSSAGGMGSAASEKILAEETGASSEGERTELPAADPDRISEGRKLIRDVSLSFESSDLISFTDKLRNKAAELSGYVEREDIGEEDRFSKRGTASLTIRIPTEKLDTFLAFSEGEAKLLRKSESARDITLEYHDIEAKKRALEVEQERLLELVAKAESMDAIISLEQRLSDIRYQLDSMSSSLRLYDNQVQYSTVEIYVSERSIPSSSQKDSFSVRLRTGLLENLDNIRENGVELLLGFLILLPQLLFLVLLILLLLFMVKRIRRRAGKRKAASPDQSGRMKSGIPPEQSKKIESGEKKPGEIPGEEKKVGDGK